MHPWSRAMSEEAGGTVLLEPLEEAGVAQIKQE